MKLRNLFFLTLIPLSVYAKDDVYKIVIITDPEQATIDKANEYKNYLLTKPPFSTMGEKLQITFQTLSVEDMDCGNKNPDSERIVSCNQNRLRRVQRREDAHLAMAFTSKGSGGAGGGIPIASIDYPIQTMFHEMLHTFGLADEYTYEKPGERSEYCSNPRNKANIVYFQDTPPYANDGAARGKHQSDIPWYGQIAASHPIITGTNLGSPEVTPLQPGLQDLGIYRGGSCDSTTTPGWRPYQKSIMRGYSDDTIYPLYEQIIKRNIASATGNGVALPPPELDCHHSNSPEVEELNHDVHNVVKKM